MSATIHIRDNGDGTMTAREMFREESVARTFTTPSYLSAACRYLESRWPGSEFRKAGWSANAREAIYHFDEVTP